MGQCLEEYRRKIGLYNQHFHGRNIMVPKRQSRVTMDPMTALTVIVLVCCAVAALGWGDYSSKRWLIWVVLHAGLGIVQLHHMSTCQ